MRESVPFQCARYVRREGADADGSRAARSASPGKATLSPAPAHRPHRRLPQRLGGRAAPVALGGPHQIGVHPGHPVLQLGGEPHGRRRVRHRERQRVRRRRRPRASRPGRAPSAPARPAAPGGRRTPPGPRPAPVLADLAADDAVAVHGGVLGGQRGLHAPSALLGLRSASRSFLVPLTSSPSVSRYACAAPAAATEASSRASSPGASSRAFVRWSASVRSAAARSARASFSHGRHGGGRRDRRRRPDGSAEALRRTPEAFSPSAERLRVPYDLRPQRAQPLRQCGMRGEHGRVPLREPLAVAGRTRACPLGGGGAPAGGVGGGLGGGAAREQRGAARRPTASRLLRRGPEGVRDGRVNGTADVLGGSYERKGGTPVITVPAPVESPAARTATAAGVAVAACRPPGRHGGRQHPSGPDTL